MPSEAELLMMLLTERDGSEFDGEIHLSSEEGERIRAALSAASAVRSEGDAWPYPEAWRDDKSDDDGDLIYLWRIGGGSFTLNFLTSGTVVACYVESDPHKSWAVKLGDTSPVQTREDGIREAAKLAETFDGPGHIFAPGGDADLPKGWAGCRRTIAAAILALLSQPEGR
jgi:hypothetical protein